MRVEERADDFAIRHSTPEELLGGRRFMEVCKRHESIRSDGFSDLRVVKGIQNIERRLGILRHPSLESRIRKIELELCRRDIKWDRRAEDSKVTEIIRTFDFFPHFFRPREVSE